MAEPSLHIGVDGRELLGKPTGVGRYLLEVLRAWAADPAWPHHLTLFVPAPLAPDIASELAKRVTLRTVPGKPGTWWEQWTLPRAMRASAIDVFFAPGYTAPLAAPCPYVVAIYDVSFAAHPEWFSWREGARRRWVSLRAAHGARAVVTISEFSASEITRLFRVARERLVLAPPGAPPLAQPGDDAREPLVLYVGSLFNRRHIPLLIDGFAEAARRVPGARLVLVGDNRTSPAVDPAALAAAAGVSGAVEWRAYVSDAERERLYSQARIFAFLSRYEGFAMTPLEALAHGVPSVLLDTPVSREVYGSGARLVSADRDDVGRALSDLLSDDTAHADLLNRARPLLQKYSWTDTARSIQRALEEAAGWTDSGEPGNRETAEPGNRGTGKPGDRETGKPGEPAAPSSVDIVIVSFNTAEDVIGCLRSVFQAPPARLGTVWVVDNASTDGTVARVRVEFPAVRCLALDRNEGFGAANNRALRASTAPLVLLLNSDTVVPPGAIDTLVTRLEATSAVAAGPRLIDGHGAPEISFGPMLSPVAEWRQRQWVRLAASSVPADRAAVEQHLADERFVDWVSGACLLVRHQEATEAGLFDERYFMYEEDVDLCAALRARGGRILFAPSAEITHLRRRSTSQEGPSANVHYLRSHVAFYEKHLPAWTPVLKAWMRLRGRSVR